MRQLEKIRKTLMDRNYYFLVPNDLTAMPVQLKKMQKDDEEGNLIEGGYYSINELSEEFGDFYKILTWVDDAHKLITWGTTKNDEIPAVIELLTMLGLTNARVDKGSGLELETYEIDWNSITPADFAIFTLSALRDVPKKVATEESLEEI